jgi:phosphomevalonate kinase
MRLSVPGNLLLLGEYAVLEEGGLGLTLAADRRVRAEVRPSAALQIIGEWGSGSARWDAGAGETSGAAPSGPLFAAAVSAFQESRAAAAGVSPQDIPLPCVRISVDSTAFFRPDGGKAGLGGSAAVSVALACALLHACGEEEAARGPEAARLALRAHRAAQGGRGSGYDVMCSFHGGLGIFRGGAEPAWRPCAVSWRPAFALFAGPAPVSTPAAIRRYTEWKARAPAGAREFLRASNAALLSFTAARTAEEARDCLSACRDLGIRLGDEIGVEARIPAPAGIDPAWCKSIGAGNELGLLALPSSVRLPAAAGLTPMGQSAGGVAWEH